MKALVEFLIAAGGRAPSADNMQPWQVCCTDASLAVRYDQGRVGGVTFPREHPATRLAFGAMAEQMLQAANHAGVAARLTTPSADGDVAEFLIELPADGNPGADLSALRASCPVFRRHTNRFPFQRAPLPEPVREYLREPREPPVRLCLFDSPAAITPIAQLVEAGSRLRFRIREVNEWLAASLRFTPEEAARGDGLDVATIPLPPGGSHVLRMLGDWKRVRWLNRLGLFRALAKMDAAPLHQAPGIVAIIAPADGPGAFAAGRELARTWIALNAAGVAVHPYYVVCDITFRQRQGGMPKALAQEGLRLVADTGIHLGLAPGEALHMLLRVGLPTRAAPSSARLPRTRWVVDPGPTSHPASETRGSAA